MPIDQQKPRQILFVLASGYLPERITGANVSSHSLCRRLLAAGMEPIVVCRDERAAGSADGAGAPAPPYAVLRLKDPVAAMFEMIGVLKPAAVVVRGPWPAAQVVESLPRHKLHIYFESSFLGHDFPSPAKAPQLRYSTVSPFLTRLASAYVGGPVATIPPLIEPDDYRCERRGDAVLFVNPVAAKGVHLASAIAERLPHRRFLFLKAWPDQARAPHILVAHPNVEWVESTQDMRTLYARARLLLAPTVWEEAFGRVVVEAQISGIPCVASDRGALPETVGDGGAILSLGDPVDTWCETIERLFDDEREYAARSAAAKANAARPEFAPEAAFARFLEFISS